MAGSLAGVFAGLLTGVGTPVFGVVLVAEGMGFFTGVVAGFEGVVTDFCVDAGVAGFFTDCGVDFAGVITGFERAFAGEAFVGVFLGSSLSTSEIFCVPAMSISTSSTKGLFCNAASLNSI